MVGGHGAEERPVLRVVGVAVFRHPARPGEQLGVAAHVDQRDGAEQRAEALRVAGQHVGDQDAAVGAAFRRDTLRLGDAAAHEVGGDRREIVMRQALARAPAGFVPGVPNSPPPRMLATTLVPPRSSQSLPIAEL